MKKLLLLSILILITGCAGHNPPPDGTQFTQEKLAISNGEMVYPLTMTELKFRGAFYYSVNPSEPELWITTDGLWVVDTLGVDFANELSYAYRFIKEHGVLVPAAEPQSQEPDSDLSEEF